MSVRRATVEDAEAGAALLTAALPDGLATAAGVRHRLTTTPRKARYVAWIEELDCTPRGWATCGLDWMSARPGDASCQIVVHPDHRGRGVGTSLWEAVDTQLRAIGARRVLGEARDEPVAQAFAAAHGFAVSAATTVLALDPRALPAPAPPEPPIEVRPFRSFGDDLEELFAVDLSATLDEPGEWDVSGMTFEAWRTFTVENPTFSLDASNAALVDGRVVGATLLYVDTLTGRALNGGTGVLRTHRGQGLATLMKRHSLAAAAAAGVTRVITQNDDGNAAMLAVNERLGYAPFGARLDLVRAAPDEA